MLADEGIYFAGDAKPENRFESREKHKHRAGNQAYPIEMGQITDACDAAENEADFRGKNFGSGIHHCRLDLRNPEDGLADSAIGAV